ncbi:MFS transporter [Salinispora arenicola]|uniref:MFS transporter n=1 Tax=Salinispora arenicola TaxID=168697 RepID=UPI0027DD3A5B|nr:MFS transporter [Salinispora arenicola]
MWVNLARAGLLAVLAAGIVGGWAGLPLLYFSMFLLGTGDVFCRNAAQVLVPSITPREDLAVANARIMATQEAGAGFVGPLVGALLFGVAVALPFGLDAVTFLCSAILLSRIRYRRPRRRQPPPQGCCRKCLWARSGYGGTTCYAAWRCSPA